MRANSNKYRRRRVPALTACLLAVACVGLAACGSTNSSSSSSGSGKAKDLNIAFFTDAQNNAYLQAAVKQAQAVAKKNGAHIDVLSADWNPNQQLNQVENAVSSGKYKALVIEAIDGAALCQPVKNALSQGMVVAVYNTPLCKAPTGASGAHELYTNGTTGYFGRYEYQSGETLAQQVAKALHGQGTIGYVTGPTQNSIVQETGAGIKDALKAYPGIHLVASVPGNWDAAQGLTATQDLVSGHPDINGIIYGVDQMAVPSVNWLKQSGKLGNKKIVSLGGTKQGFEMIKNGEMYSAIDSLPQEEAGYALQSAIDKLEGKSFSAPGWNSTTNSWIVQADPRFHGNGAVVNKSNVAQFPAEWSV